MVRSLVFFVAVLLIVFFAISNMHPIPLRLFAGEAVNVRLFYLVLFSFLIGIVSASYFFLMLRYHDKKKKARQAKSGEDEDEA
ncbi:MAG: hypothetical protein NTZ09_07440 [Candidatus Hydrogenedentes bacterium]|nr:DUF1049 domain-containing protein [Chloroflexota bacterium]MCX5770088.1 hypothetical protein [Candidatus Hydrogenedentota bacterium]